MSGDTFRDLPRPRTEAAQKSALSQYAMAADLRDAIIRIADERIEQILASRSSGRNPTEVEIRDSVTNPGARRWAIDSGRELMFDGQDWIITYEPVQTYQPVTTGISFGGQPVIEGTYRRENGHCDVQVFINFGLTSPGVLSLGPTFAMPTAVDSASAIAGECLLFDANGPLYYLEPILLTSTQVEPRVLTVVGSPGAGPEQSLRQITNAFPLAIQAGDGFRASLRYRMLTPYL